MRSQRSGARDPPAGEQRASTLAMGTLTHHTRGNVRGVLPALNVGRCGSIPVKIFVENRKPKKRAGHGGSCCFAQYGSWTDGWGSVGILNGGGCGSLCAERNLATNGAASSSRIPTAAGGSIDPPERNSARSANERCDTRGYLHPPRDASARRRCALDRRNVESAGRGGLGAVGTNDV